MTPIMVGHPPDATQLPKTDEVALYVYGLAIMKNTIAEYVEYFSFT